MVQQRGRSARKSRRIVGRMPTKTAGERRMASSLHPTDGGTNMSTSRAAPGHYLIASDFDQTLSFNDSGLVLSELIGVPNFREKVAGLSDIHLVQQGAELAYLLRHDPEFRCVRREHLIEAGADEYHFSFYVISAAPRTVVESALEGIVPADHIYGAECAYDATSGEICAVTQVPAGYGKVAILEALASQLQISPDRTVYVGDGSSDVHVMLHVNSGNGFTIAVSEAKHITRIARRTVISDNALSVLVPILEDVVGWDAARIRQLFASKGLALQAWDKARTDWVTLR